MGRRLPSPEQPGNCKRLVIIQGLPATKAAAMQIGQAPDASEVKWPVQREWHQASIWGCKQPSSKAAASGDRHTMHDWQGVAFLQG